MNENYSKLKFRSGDLLGSKLETWPQRFDISLAHIKQTQFRNQKSQPQSMPYCVLSPL